jgi:RNA polymerase sigma-70 factor, ECF subfamily
MLLPDMWLVRRARRGDQKAFGTLYRRHAPRIYNLLRRLSPNETNAEDLTQETFLAAYRRLDSWRGTGSLSAWLCGIAVGCYRTAQRAAYRHGGMEEMLSEGSEEVLPHTDPLNDPLAHCTAEETRRLLESAIAELPPLCREAFVLVYVEEFAYRDAAQILEIPIGTVQSRLNRAKRLLQARLAETLAGETSLPSEARQETECITTPGQPTAYWTAQGKGAKFDVG